MLPGKKYKPEDMLQVLRRRIWLVLVPFAVVSAGTAVVVRSCPTVQVRGDHPVEPQRVPEAYVRSAVTTDLRDRLRTIQVRFMSRTRLEQIIESTTSIPKSAATASWRMSSNGCAATSVSA